MDIKIPGYEIDRMLGKGGMGAVYEATQLSLGRKVALKLMHPALSTVDESFAARFLREARATATLKHPNIVTIYETGEVDQHLFMTLEFVEDGSLADLLERGPLADRRIIEIMSDTCSALEAAHAKGFVHRDIKPDNILIDTDGRVLVADFGIVKTADTSEKITATMGTVGSPHFMSPEQIKGETLDGRSDLYSLGIVLFEMLEGQLPFDGDNFQAVQYKHLTEPLPALKHGNKDLVEITVRLLAKDREHRYASAKALLEALAAVQSSADQPVQANQTSAPLTATTPAPIAPLPATTPTSSIHPAMAPEAKIEPTGAPAASGPRKARIFDLVLTTVIAITAAGWWWFDQQAKQQLESQPALVVDTPSQSDDPATIESAAAREQPLELAAVPLTIATLPEHALVSIEGITQPYRDGLPLPPGEYRVTVTADGHETRQRTIQLSTDNRRFVMELPAARYALTVKAVPADATIRILNIKPPYQAGMSLESGRYQVSVSAPGFLPRTEWVELKDRDVTREISLERGGYALNLSVDPSDARLEIEGLGSYRQGQILPPGQYTILASRTGYETQRIPIALVAGKVDRAITLAPSMPGATATEAGAADPTTEKAAYDEAFNALKELRYADASGLFSSFLERFPAGDFSDNAQYWFGEANYATRNYRLALAAFEKLLADYPDSPKVADARLKLGFSYFALELWADAERELKQVISQHPDSTVSRLAETRLRSMRLSGHIQ